MLFIAFKVNSQTPINLSVQPNYTYTETFADIDNWVYNTTPQNGTFTAGIGAAAWRGNDIGGTGSVPNGTKLTVSSTFFQTPSPTFYNSGFYKGAQSVFMITSGTTDNTSAIAVDFFLDFTSVNAGTLSFDWNSLNNSTGNRNGSLRVYSSIDGVVFTEITSAQVLNFTNNSPTAGSISNITLPSNFSGSSTARLRFYYSNGSGGSSGSRPRINIDNVKVTALPTIACIAPTAQPTTFLATNVLYNSIQFSYTPASPTPNNYLVIMSNNSSLTSHPINNINYNIGDQLGDGTVISITNGNSVNVTGLSNSSTHYFFIYSMNNICTGGPLYNIINPLTGSATTLAGPINCVAPVAQPTSLILSNITVTSITGNFTAAANTDEYLIVRCPSPTFTGTLNNGTTYNGGNVLGNGTVITRTSNTNFTALNLIGGTQYYFFVFGINSQFCNNGPAYNTVAPLVSNATTIALPTCVTPASQPTLLNLSATNNSVNGYFTATNADGYIVVRSLTSSLGAVPVNGTNYVTGNFIGSGVVVSNSLATSFIDNGLSSTTQYYYFIFSKNSICNGTNPMFLTTNPLTGNATTTSSSVNNFYFGNLHAHSSYSDGNVDNLSFTPADNYAYAKNSLCMDFLGISEHNHATAGMSLSNWQPGTNQAAAATTSNFLALYGLEYGVISNGGHVLIYGSNNLIGWEAGNYNLYVPKSDYTGTPETSGTTGLFRMINDLNRELGYTSFATFAHPDLSDYNNLANIPYNISADSAAIGSAVASGPAFSSNTTYSDPPTSMGYLDYYNRMLSKGYHIGPLMDHDSHYTNFGRSSNNRLAVIAPAINSINFYEAMRARRFYATEDCDTRVNFTLNNELMGSIITGSEAPAISIHAIDPTNVSTPLIKLMFGVIGSGALPVQIASSSSNTLTYTDNSLNTNSTGYYYADITIAGNRTITAPIWYTKNTIVPLKFISFTATVENDKKVVLNFQTSNEINTEKFFVERSLDGVRFEAIDSLNSTQYIALNDYSSKDYHPYSGINYYRIKQIDKDGKLAFSKTVSVNLKDVSINAFNIYPNPVSTELKLNIHSKKDEKVTLLIHDIFGKIILREVKELAKGNQILSLNTNRLSPGNYYISLQWAENVAKHKFLKLF